ncbi:MAG: phosphoribosylamine--glycine ligase [Candidatus Caldatribacteriota bacterium]|nr:phosphoribosylamine--glycine ligase [Candidatus Caldatribacteriota bacterium]
MTTYQCKNKIKKVLVVGSWAKEQIIIQNIKRNPNIRAYAYLDTRNPGIIALADGYRAGDLKDINNIKDYCEKEKIDLVLVTTASPLQAGVVDILEESGICAFGPRKAAARLESDKAFARELLKKIAPEAVPEYRTFEKPAQAMKYAEKLDWQVAVKPIGLTDGLGVRVYGDQLKTPDAVKDYIHEIYQNHLSGSSQIIIEEKLWGEEFTIQAFVCGELLVSTPAVQDFKKLLPGDRGPNTASMGSYSNTGCLLPFMQQEDYRQAVRIMRKTMIGLREKTGQRVCGFLYGQFMLTTKGIKLIEYNFRPGDPEWMNTVKVLQDNIVDVIVDLLNGEERNIQFIPEATVCQYIVPPDYPARSNLVLDVEIDQTILKKNRTDMYYSCGLDESSRLRVGDERGIALLTKASSIEQAKDQIEQGMTSVKGKFCYRRDIGNRDVIKKKVKKCRVWRDGIIIREAREDEFLNVYQLISQSPPLEKYFQHFYRIMLRYFSSTCIVAENQHRLVGWQMGFVSQNDQKTYFLWQIGVHYDMQGKGLGGLLLEETERKAYESGCTRMEVTIDPENVPSEKLFIKNNYHNISQQVGTAVQVKGREAVRDYYSPGRHFMVFEKQLN